MINKHDKLDVYLMGIGGTGMGAMAGLLKQMGCKVRGSDSAVYSPMKEKLEAWGIHYKTPYDEQNLKEKPDLVIVGNVIRKDNPESQFVLNNHIPYDSFPHALKKLFLEKAVPIVITGTHGKTTTSALIAHTLKKNKQDVGYLIGGIPLNYGESFSCPTKEGAPFVVEGDEYDTAFFDKGPKFMHYCPKYLLSTSLEYDHADIYPDISSIIKVFSKLYSTLNQDSVLIYNKEEQNIQEAINNSNIKAKIYSYGKNGDYYAENIIYHEQGINFTVFFRAKPLGDIILPLYGQHNLSNALGAYGILHCYGLSHEDINLGFKSFLGVKRRLEFLGENNGTSLVDDFAHHPTAIRETLKALKQKFPQKEIWAIFEPRSASSCRQVFAKDFPPAFSLADRVFIAPLGRKFEEDVMLNTQEMAKKIELNGGIAKAYDDLYLLFSDVLKDHSDKVMIIMTNGDLMGHKNNFINNLLKQL